MTKSSVWFAAKRFVVCAVVLLSFFLVMLRPVVAGAPNPAFGAGGWVVEKFLFGDVTNYGNGVAIQADGKIVVAGENEGNEQDTVIVRYNTDGSLDTSFDGDGKAVIDAGGDDRANAVAIQANGKIVIAGLTYSDVGQDFVVLRLNSDGSPDTGFGVNGIVKTDFSGSDAAQDVVIQGDGKIVVAGYSNKSNPFLTVIAIARYNSDGSMDTSFDSDGKVTTAIGVEDSRANAVALQADGKIVAGGSFSFEALALVRYNTNGSLDTTFDTDGIVTTAIGGFGSSFEGLAIQTDQKIVGVTTAETSGPMGSVVAVTVLRYNPNGSLDTGFDTDGRAGVGAQMGEAYGTSVAMQSDNKIVAVGASRTFDMSQAESFFAARFNIDGSLDTTFDTDGHVETEVTPMQDNGANSVAIQADGKIVLAGSSNQDVGVVRYNTNGSLDGDFSGDGKVTTPIDGPLESLFQAVAVQGDGKIVVGGFTDNGNDEDLALARYNADGSLDTSFGGDGKVTQSFGSKDEAVRGLAVQSDGKILVVDAVRGATNDDAALARFNADGSLDAGFGGGIITTPFNKNDVWNDVVVQPDGKIVVAGGVKGLLGSGVDDIALARFNSDGSFDTSFSGDGKLTSGIFSFANDIELQADGKIVVAGLSFPNIAVARFNADGTIDTSFGGGNGWFVSAVRGKNSVDERMSPLALQSDGKIIVAGDLANGSNLDIAVARYTEDGILDTTFDIDGVAITDLGGQDESREVQVQDDGKIVVGGFGSDTGGTSGFVLVRYNTNGSLDNDFANNGVGIYTRGGNWHEAYGLALANGHAYLAGQVSYDAAVLDVSVSDTEPTGRFKDVPPGYWAFTFIERLAESGITAGCGNDNYCPLSPVTRAQMAVFLERGMRGSDYSPPAATGDFFLDVSAGSFAASFIEQFFLDGITSGCGNNNYCPNAEVTRDQMAVFLLRAKYGAGYSPPAASGVFNDVPLNYWAVHWIEQLAAEGITAGCGDGNYCPNSPVNRDQMAVFLVRTFGL